MAGAGFKTFGVGDVLTASDVNTYLMQQSAMVFANAAARNTALGTATGGGNALSEGMVSYLADTDAVEVYDGSAWTAINTVVAVKFATKTDIQSSSLAAGGTAAVSGLTIAHAAATTTNKVILIANIHTSWNATSTSACTTILTAGGTAFSIGDAAGSRSRKSAAGGGSFDGTSITAFGETVPGSTSSVTYGVDIGASDASPGTNTYYVNREVDDSDAARYARYASTLMLVEVAA